MPNKKNMFSSDIFANQLSKIKNDSTELEAKKNYNIEFINIEDIQLNKYNFYSNFDTDEEIYDLAENIKRNGLQHNLVVNDKSKFNSNKYTLISGERRLKALKKLVDKGNKQFSKVPVKIVNLNENEAKIVLIETNSKTRVRTPEIILKETKELQKVYNNDKKNKNANLNERQFISKNLNMGETQAQKLITINKNLHPDFKKNVNQLGIGSSSELAKLPIKNQEAVIEIIKENNLNFKDISKSKAEQIKIQTFEMLKSQKEELKKLENYNTADDNAKKALNEKYITKIKDTSKSLLKTNSVSKKDQNITNKPSEINTKIIKSIKTIKNELLKFENLIDKIDKSDSNLNNSIEELKISLKKLNKKLK